MSELKVYVMPIKTNIFGQTIVGLAYYSKSEADKVIAEKDKEIMELKGQVNGFKNRSNLWHYNAVEEHKKFVQVDQQITELKEKHKTEVKELLCLIRDKENNFNRAFDSEEKEIRYNKYKRCLDKARIAQDDWHLHNSFYAMGHQEFEKRKCDFYDKWHRRWLELAEKFKDKETK